METVATSNSQSVLTGFVQENREKDPAYQLETLKTSIDLHELLAYCSYPAVYTEKVRVAAWHRILYVAPLLLCKETDFVTLSKFLIKNSHMSYGNGMFFHIAKARLSGMSHKMKTIDEVFAVKKTINDIGHIPEDVGFIFQILEDRVMFLVRKHKDRYSYAFLKNIWDNVSVMRPAREDLATLLPEALQHEVDLLQLHDFFQKTFSGWDRYKHGFAREIRIRIVVLLREKIPIETTSKILEQYRWMADRYAPEDVGNSVDMRLASVFTKALKKHTTIASVISFLKLHHFPDNTKTKASKKSFEDRLSALVKKMVKNENNAEVYPAVIEQLCKHHFHVPASILERGFLKLVPVYFAVPANRKLSTAMDWNQYCDELPGWAGIVESIIAETNDLETLINAEHHPTNIGTLGSYEQRNFLNRYTALQPSIEAQIAKTLDAMIVPNEAFLWCIQNKRFFGNEEIFLKKATLFA